MPRRSLKAATEIAAADRKAAAVELRARGYTFERIAEELGYANASGASKAYHAALRSRPSQSVDMIREQESARLEWLWARTAAIVEDPGPRSSAIGKIVVYPAGHEKAGQPVPDSSTALRAATEYRHQSESLRKLYSADKAPAMPALSDADLIRLAEIRVAQRQLDARAPRVPMAALPASYEAMPAERQMRVQLDREAAALRAQRADAARLEAEDADVVEAEIVDD